MTGSGQYVRTPAIRRKNRIAMERFHEEHPGFRRYLSRNQKEMWEDEPWRREEKSEERKNYYRRNSPTKAQIRALNKGRELARFCHGTKKELRAHRKAIKKAIQVATTLPRTKLQIAVAKRTIKLAAKVAHSMKRTPKQLAASRKAIKKIIPLGLAALRKLGRFRSKYEKVVFRALKKMIPSLRADCFIEGTLYRGDIVSPSAKRIVEVDGKHWHDKVHDKKRDKVLKQLGWKVLRIPSESERDIDEDLVRRLSKWLMS